VTLADGVGPKANHKGTDTMKMPGFTTPSVREQLMVFTRPTGFIQFMLKAVSSFDEFNKLCPVKQPSWSMNATGEKTYAYNSPEYRKYRIEHNKKFEDWLVITSITEPNAIVWDKVKLDDPETYHFWSEELAEMGISAGERNNMIKMVDEINAITEDSVQKAMADFLSTVQRELKQLEKEISQVTEQVTTQSSESVSDSESSQPELEFPE
jgi:hypothetical protein